MRMFVYGTLKRGFANHRLLQDATFIRRARTAQGFELYDVGGHPGLVTGGKGKVSGELYEVVGEPILRIDKLEGHPDYFIRLPIFLDDGSIADAYLLGMRHVQGCRRLSGGRWPEGADDADRDV